MGQAVAVAGIVVAAVGAVVSAVNTISGGKAMQKQSRYNAFIVRQAALHERQLAEEAVSDRGREHSLLTGAGRAAVGASGIAADMGSGAAVLDDNAMMAELDVLRIKSNSEHEAWGMEAKARDIIYGGQIARHSAGMRAVAGLLGTAGSLMMGGKKGGK